MGAREGGRRTGIGIEIRLEYASVASKLKRWALTGFRAIPLVLMLGLLAFGSTVAAQNAFRHHLELSVMLFVVGSVIAATAAWFYPHRHAVAVMLLGAAPAGIVAFEAGLVWEPFVAFCVFSAVCVIPAVLSIMWWPLRKLSYDERVAVYQRLLKQPHDERMRRLWSRQYDHFVSNGESPRESDAETR